MISSSLSSKMWNPYSLFRIPIYGGLMILLVLTFEPNILSRKKVSSIVPPFFLPGGIAPVVGILDEVMDVVLDIVGVVLCGILMCFYNHRFPNVIPQLRSVGYWRWCNSGL